MDPRDAASRFALRDGGKASRAGRVNGAAAVATFGGLRKKSFPFRSAPAFFGDKVLANTVGSLLPH